MTIGIAADFATRHMTRFARTWQRALLALVVAALALAPAPVRADNDNVRVDGTFTVSFTRPSAVDYCAASGGDLSIEAHGIGSLTGMGPMFMTVKKCLKFVDLTYAGTFTMTAGNGDTLNGTYAGTQTPANENGFGPFEGTLTVTGGTGQFEHATGGLTFTAVASPASVGSTGKLNGTAFYLVRGNKRVL